ncbi:TlyA family RNA methyltransferase [Spiroplasma endosymbiont of Labia minor]|uniref:TlyA family RNA methyltransferase n=1 Tax=Spiroplasma endosymbiont of Labia minor TaxID=3066305 RepID=UPI0030D60AC3
MNNKKRLDDILVEKKLTPNKSKARSLIIDKKVLVNNEKIIKPGTLFNETKITIKIINNERKFVSRAGKKLFKAVNIWNIDLKNKVCLDIGSSTGGFTQVCLESGAKKVYALDVGTNQLEWSLRTNPKVISMENTNFRYTKKEDFKDTIDFFCCDVSFISLEKIFPSLNNIIDDNISGVLLIKPQFELTAADVIKGKITSSELHIKAINQIFKYANNNNFSVMKLSFSPILGNKKQNIEYIMLVTKTKNNTNSIMNDEIIAIVNNAWKYFSEDDSDVE